MNENTVTINRFQRIIEKVLCIWTFSIAVCHIFLATFQYVIPYGKYTSYVKWAGLGLIIISLIYFIGSLIATKESRIRVLSFLRRMCTFEQVILIIMLIWFIVSCYINGLNLNYPTVFFFFHDWLLFDMAVCVLILFPMTRALGLERAKKTIEIIIHIIVVTYTVFTIICLWHIFHLEVLNLPSGELAGVTKKVQLMLGKHYNLTGMIATVMFCFCMFILCIQKERFIFGLYIFFSVVHLVVIYLSNSRTVFIGMLAFVGIFSYLVCWKQFSSKKITIRFLSSFFIATILCTLFWCGRNWTFTLFENVTHFSEELAKENGNVSAIVNNPHLTMLTGTQNFTSALHLLPNRLQAEVVKISASSDGVRDISSGLNYRENIWIAALKVLVSSKFITWFGVTPVEVPDALNNIGGYWQEVAHAHNSVLQTGVSMGVPAMFLFICFILCICVFCIRSISRKNSTILTVVPSIIFCFLVIGMAEAYLTVYFSSIACALFLFGGYITVLPEEQKDNYIQEKEKKFDFLPKALVVSCALIIIVSAVCYSKSFLYLNSDRISGSGTKNDPYRIENKEDLEYFRDLVNHGNRFENRYFLQTADIDLQNVEWKPIGIYGTGFFFEGIYDGNNFQIKNLYISGKKMKWPERAALFGYLKGTVNNLTISSGSICGKEIDNREITGENLLLGTNRGTVNFRIDDYGFGGSLIEDGKGIKVSMATTREKGWLILHFNDGRSKYLQAEPKGQKYTLSFKVKSNIQGAKIQISQQKGDGKDTQIYYGIVTIERADEWQQVELSAELIGIEATSQIIFFDLRPNVAGTDFYIQDLKLEAGSERTLWSQSSDDAIAVNGRVFHDFS